MTSGKGSKKNFSRRDFIKTTAVGVGGAALTGLSPAEAKAAGHPEKWDRETDVVVVGCGGAGTTAAITAHDAGAEVIIVEKAPEGGGNSRVGGGQFTYSTPELKDQAALYIYNACNGTTPMDVCQAWADEMVHNREWLDEMGVENSVRPSNDGSLVGGADYEKIPGADGLGTGIMAGVGMAWYTAIEKQMKKRGIEILFNTPATELVQDCATKEIVGVKAGSDGRDIFIKARKGVVLCSGGFEFNEDMKKNYLRPSTIKFTGWIYNTGDGIRMAQAVGADLWHMNLICSAAAAIETPPMKMAWMYPFTRANGYIWVNKYGERFVGEGGRTWGAHQSFMGMSLWDWRSDRKDTEYPLSPHYLIFDEVTRKAGAVADFGGMQGMANAITPKRLGGNASEWGAKDGGWSPDNSVEIEKGWIMKADTVKALAEVMAEPELLPEKLAATVDRWNEFCEAGEDKDFGRSGRSLVKIATPPYYAVRYWPGGFSTCGGPRKNAEGQVMGVNGNPIGRLYAAGSLGHTLGQVYSMAGANYCECFVWGRITGRNVASLKSWS
jgi:succinate dehydrogenase/fumarate reductase flavoprotein subunit